MTAISSVWPVFPQTLVPTSLALYNVVDASSTGQVFCPLWHCDFLDSIQQSLTGLPNVTPHSGAWAWKARPEEAFQNVLPPPSIPLELRSQQSFFPGLEVEREYNNVAALVKLWWNMGWSPSQGNVAACANGWEEEKHLIVPCCVCTEPLNIYQQSSYNKVPPPLEH